MSRLSLSNIFRNQSHVDFERLTIQFWRAAEIAFDAPCRLDVTMMNRAKAYTTFWDENHQADLNAMNDANTHFKASNLKEIDAHMWARTRYAEVSIRPVEPDSAPTSAWAHVEFLGQRPKQATFYIQGGDREFEPRLDKALEKLRRQNPRMIAGDGYDGNGVNSGFMPMTFGAALGGGSPSFF